MSDASSRSFSEKLQNLTHELRTLDRELKSNPQPNAAALREFRQALDNVRMTAWTVSELLNARETQKDPQAVISFMAAERLRRLSQMVRDLSGDIEHGGPTWPVASVEGLQRSVNLLQQALGELPLRRSEPARRDGQND